MGPTGILIWEIGLERKRKHHVHLSAETNRTDKIGNEDGSERMKNETFSMIFKKISKTYAVALFSCLLFVLGSTLVPAQQAHAAGNTYYVAKNGSNSGSGTETSPWLTIKYAAIRAVAGDTVYVKNGTYNEQIWITSAEGARGGSAGYPVTIKAYPGHLPIIDGTGLPQRQWVHGTGNDQCPLHQP